MSKDYNHRHPEIDRVHQRQIAITRYRRLKNLKRSELALDDELFIENFEAAMRYMWGFRNTTKNTVVDNIPKSKIQNPKSKIEMTSA